MFRLWEKFEGAVLKYGLAAILLVIPLYPKFPVIDVPGTYVNIRAEDFLIAALTFVFLISVIRRKIINKLAKDKLTWAILVFLGAGLLALVSAIFLTKTVVSHIALLHWVRRVEYILPLFIAAATVKTRKDLWFYSQILVVAILGIFLYALGQIYLNFPVISTQNEEFSKGIALRLTPGARIPSTFAGHYDLAAFLVLVVPVLVALLVTTPGKVARGLWIFSILISYWLILSSASRISFMAFIVGLGSVLFLLRKKLWIPPAVALAVFGLLFSGELGARYTRTLEIYFSSVTQRLALPKVEITEPPFVVEAPTTLVPSPPPGEVSLITPGRPTPKPATRRGSVLTQEPKVSKPEPIIEERSLAIRLNIEWPRAVRAFVKNPLLGTGYSSITLATDNDYLRLLGEVGILGFVAFLFIFARLWEKLADFIFKLKRLNLESSFVIGFTAGTIGLLVNAAFIDVFEASKIAIIFWTLAGISLSIIKK